MSRPSPTPRGACRREAPADAAAALRRRQGDAGITPKVAVTHLPDVQTIDGFQAHHLRIIETVSLPAGPRPPGLPPTLGMTFDLWTTAAVKPPKGVQDLALQMAGRMGGGALKEIAKAGFILKGRLNLVGTVMTMTVRDLKTDAVAPADAFRVPAGYKEVPPPHMPGREPPHQPHR